MRCAGARRHRRSRSGQKSPVFVASPHHSSPNWITRKFFNPRGAAPVARTGLDAVRVYGRWAATFDRVLPPLSAAVSLAASSNYLILTRGGSMSRTRWGCVIIGLLVLVPPVAWSADLTLTPDGKVPGTPFQYLQDQIDRIQLTPGPQGIQGPAGLLSRTAVGGAGEVGGKEVNPQLCPRLCG